MLSLIIKPMIISLAGLALYRNCRLESAAYRYYILSLLFVLLGLSLALTILFPLWQLDIQFDPSSVWLSSSSELIERWPLIFCFYICIVLWLSLYNLLGWYALAQRRTLRKENTPALQQQLHTLAQKMSITRPIQLVLGDTDSIPCTWGVLRPVLQLPATALTWSKPMLTMVLLHELAHIRNHDFSRKLFSHQITALFWFIPWLWYLLRASEEMAEQTADNYVLSFGNSDTDYAQVLLEAQQGKFTNETLAMGISGHGHYYHRIFGVLDRYSDKSTPPTKEQRTIVLFLLLASLLIAAINFRSSPYSKYQFQWPIHIEQKTPIETPPKSKMRTKYEAPYSPKNQSPSLLIDPPKLKHPTEELRVLAYPQMNVTAEPVILQGTDIQSTVKMTGYLPIKITSPIYPRRAIQLQLGSQLTAMFSIDSRGKTKNIKIIHGQYQHLFSKSVIDAVKTFEFHAPTINGEKVELDGVTERFTFKIEPK